MTLPAIAMTAESDRLTWAPSDIAAWSRAMAVACAEAGHPLRDPVFTDIEPTGETDAELYLKASDASFWRKAGARRLRIMQEEAELRDKKIGKHAEHIYSGASAAVWSAHKKQANAAFVRNSVVFDHATGQQVALANVIKDEKAKIARYYTFLQGIQTLAKGLRWAMLTITLPPEFHANPEHSKGRHEWNGMTAEESHKHIGKCWNTLRAGLRKKGIVLSGVRTEEPHADGTPHWHCCFFFKDEADLHEICRATLRLFPAGLRVRSARPRKNGRKLKFEAKQYATLADFDAGNFHRNTRIGAQCQIDIGAPKTGADTDKQVRSFASYVLKYVSKTLGIDQARAVDANGKPLYDDETAPAEKVRQHRETYGIRSIEFYGIPKGAASCWDILRQVDLKDKDADIPPPIRFLANICQKDKGEGIHEFLAMLGGLSCAPTPAIVTIKPLKLETQTKYRGKGTKLVGVELTDSAGVHQYAFKKLGREILRTGAADAVQAAYDAGNSSRAETYIGAAEAAASGLVQIGTVKTSAETQRVAASADVQTSHTIIASAGSGKTTLLVARAKHLLEAGIPAGQIVIATFTREAAANVLERLAGEGVHGVQVGTMHALSGKWLAATGERAEGFDQVIEKATAIGGHGYYLLVDEAQDLSPEQWAWAKAHAKTLYSVGDHRQAIYGWRGAHRGGLIQQARETGGQGDMFNDAGGLYALPVNRRSASAIVALGNAIAGDANTPAQSLMAGGAVSRYKAGTAAEEIAELIRFVEGAQGTKAVLARTNSEVARIRAELTLAGHAGVPVLTIHGSKGLEFDAVALSCGHRKPSETGEEATETFYVATTRAKTSLHLTSIGQLPEVLQSAIAKTTNRVA